MIIQSCENCKYFSSRSFEEDNKIRERKGLPTLPMDHGDCLFSPPHLWKHSDIKGYLPPKTHKENVCSKFKIKRISK